MVDPTALFRAWAPKLMAKLMADFAFSVEDAAAIMGNAGHESGGFRLMQERDPTSGRGGLGIFQWTGPRRRDYEAWLARKNANPTDFDQSYAFLYRELISTERRAVPATKAAKAYVERLPDGRTIPRSSLYAKVVAFENAFERAGVKHYDSRFRWAQIALTAWQANPVTVLPTARPLEVPTVTTVVVPTPAVLPSATPKPQFQSKGILGSIVAGLGGVIGMVLAARSPALGATWETLSPVLLSGVVTVGGAITAYIGRRNATQPIAGTESAAEAKVQQAVAATDRATVVAAEQAAFAPDTLGRAVVVGATTGASITELLRQGIGLYEQLRPMANLAGHFVPRDTPLGKIVAALPQIDATIDEVKAAIERPAL